MLSSDPSMFISHLAILTIIRRSPRFHLLTIFPALARGQGTQEYLPGCGRHPARLHALLDTNVYLRQTGAHVDGPKELDGEVLEFTMLGRRTDMRLRHDASTLSLALLMAFFLVHTRRWSGTSPCFPQTRHTAVTTISMHILAFSVRTSCISVG